MQPLTAADVQAALDQLGLDTRIQVFDSSTATSQMAADNIGCALGQIVKSLAFIVDDQPILVLASGDQRVDDRKIATLFGVGRKKVKIATPEECVRIYGYLPGGVPPVGHRTPSLPTYIDDTFRRYEQLYAAAGEHNTIFPITLIALQRVTGGTLTDLARHETGE